MIMSVTISERRKLIDEAMRKFEALDKDKMFFVGVYASMLTELAVDSPRDTNRVIDLLNNIVGNYK
jgi:hypothetical protein